VIASTNPFMKVSVVIPCFNEQKTIEQIVQAVRKAPLPEREIILVDDGSNDGTTAILRERITPLVDRIIYLPDNRGKGAALRRGFREAQARPLSSKMLTWSMTRKSITNYWSQSTEGSQT